MSGTHTETEIESDGEGEVFRLCEVVPAAEGRREEIKQSEKVC